MDLINRLMNLCTRRLTGQKSERQIDAGEQLQEMEIRFLTYNAFLRFPVVKNNENDYKNERRELLERELHKFDVICLQEVFGFLNFRKRNLIKNAFKQGFLSHAESPGRGLFSKHIVDGGLLTLSRYPILKAQFKPYPDACQIDKLSEKGVLYTKIRVNGTHLHVFNTHLQSSYVGEQMKVKESIIVRIKQLILLEEIVSKTLQEEGVLAGQTILIAGDLNINANEGPINFSYLLDQEFTQKLGLDFNKELTEYDLMMRILTRNHKNVILDWQRKNGLSPVTFGDTYINDKGEEHPVETVLTHKDDLRVKQSLDYIFQYIPEDNKLVSTEWQKDGDVCIQKFEIKHPVLSHISDHYGISAILKFQKHLKH